MNVILDECLPRRLLRDIQDHFVTTVPRQGWAGRKDGELIKLADGRFDVFITMDSNIVYQQSFAGMKLCLIVLHGVNSRYETLQPLVPQIRKRILTASPGTVFHIP